MIETEWDLVLEGERYMTLGSGMTGEIIARVYHKNLPMPNHNVRLITQATNTKSPIVASFENLISITNKEGRMRAFVKATDLTNAEDIHDPITNQNLKQLPMDRYYGNYVYIEIDNDLRRTNPPVEKIEIPIRVLHV